MDAINQGKLAVNDIIELVRLYPDEFLTALRSPIEALKGIIKNAESAQIENLKGSTDIQKEIIKSISDSLRSVEDTLRLLATQSQSDQLRMEIANRTIKIAEYKMENNKILERINAENNSSREKMQQENNRSWEKLAGIGFVVFAIVVTGLIIISGNKRDRR